AVHEPRAGSDQRHHHAHVLFPSREVTPDGLGARTTLELSGTERHARGLGPSKEDLLWIRERWATLTNEALLEAGIKERVDHRLCLFFNVTTRCMARICDQRESVMGCVFRVWRRSASLRSRRSSIPRASRWAR